MSTETAPTSESFLEPTREQVADPRAVAVACVEGAHRAVLLDAAVVPDPTSHSASFQDLVRESNRGARVRFAPTRTEALAWLERRLGSGR